MLYSCLAINQETIMFVYIWKHNDSPFYVGMSKSIGRTNPLNAGGRGWFCKQTLKNIGAENVVVEVHTVLTEEEAKALEKELILKYGRIQLGTGTLTNLRSGGEGAHGMSEEGKASLSEHMRLNNPMKNPETRAKFKNRMNSPDVKILFTGDNNPSKRPEVREKLLAKWQDPEYKERQRAAKTGKPIHSDEEKEKRRQKLLDPAHPMREYHKVLNSDPAIKAKRVERLRSPEVQAKISASLKLSWAKRKGLI
jgi:hypothetical protein